MLLLTGYLVGGGGSDGEGRDDNDDHSVSDNRDERESSSSSRSDVATRAAQRRLTGSFGFTGCCTNTFSPPPRRRKQKSINNTHEDSENYNSVQLARAGDWDAEKEDFGEDLAEFDEWSLLSIFPANYYHISTSLHSITSSQHAGELGC